jgi:tetratricopeptide (TPR) repeat protein
MKHKYIYISFALIFSAFVFYLVKRDKPKTELTLMERTGAISNTSEWLNTKAAIQKLLSDLRSNPNNLKAKMQLAFAYISESRVTGNHAYYDKVALQLIGEILDERPNDYEALCAKSTVLLSQHRFADALSIGMNVVKQNAYSAFGYGILTDANVELGKYEEAIKCADKMVALRPDIRSYSRVSYLREIFGNYDGAIDAMKMAVEAGVPGAEQTEWARVYVGHLYEMTGKYAEAENQYQQSLIHRPQYAFALAGMGRVEKSKRNYEQALKYFNAAKFSLNDYSFYDECADVYRSMLKPAEANIELKKATEMLSAGNGKESDAAHGHYSDRELALLYIKSYNYDLALQHAITEYNRRPGNIDVNQTLAWVRYRRGEYTDANKLIDVAMKTNSKNPMLLFQAGLIKAKAGNLADGKKLLLQSLAMNKSISFNLMYEAKSILGKDDYLIALR